MDKNTSLYWTLSGFYFFFFAVAGVFGPYWSLYLKSIGFDAAAIGELTAIYIGGSFFAPYLWAWIADYTGKSTVLIRLASVLAAVSFSGVLGAQSFLSLALLLCCVSFFLNGVLPQLEASTLNHIGNGNNNYGNIRLWGSFGFVVTAIVLGKLLEVMSLSLVPKAVLILLIFSALITFFIPQHAPLQHAHSEESILQLLKRPTVIAFMAAGFMMFVSYSPYTIFFSIYLEDHSYERGTIGWLWALGMLAEIGVFFMMSRLIASYNFKSLLIIAYVLTTLRWLLIGFYVDNLPVLLFAQLLQAASIGIYHTVSIYMIHIYFKGKFQYRGQALYVCSAGTASVVGILGTGYLWDHFPAQVTFSLAALATMVALIITWFYVDDIQNKPATEAIA